MQVSTRSHSLVLLQQIPVCINKQMKILIPSDTFLDGWDIYRSDNVAIIDSNINNDDDCVCTYHSLQAP